MSSTVKSSAIQLKKCITPEFRVSFPAVIKAKAFEDQEAKFSVTMLFPKKVSLKLLKDAHDNARNEKWGTDPKKWPKGLRSPFRDGDEKEDTTGYAGHIFVKASSKNQPGLVNQSLQPILNERDFYAGCYARAEIIAFAYDTKGNKGVSFALMNIQKLRDGEAFSGHKAAEDVFDKVEDDSEDADDGEGSGAPDDDADSAAFQ